MKNIVIFIIIIVIIGISFALPSILFEVEDFAMEKLSYKRDSIQSKIDFQAEEIYLVKAIHGQDYNVEIVTTSPEYIKSAVIETGELGVTDYRILNLKNELIKLKEFNVLDATLENDKNIKVAMFERRYSNNIMEYSLNCVELIQNKESKSVAMESKTGKILYIEFEKDKIPQEISKEEVMRNYIKYLDLYIIDDWKLEDNILKSEKAQLAVCIVETFDKYRLTIQALKKSVMTDTKTNKVYYE